MVHKRLRTSKGQRNPMNEQPDHRKLVAPMLPLEPFFPSESESRRNRKGELTNPLPTVGGDPPTSYAPDRGSPTGRWSMQVLQKWRTCPTRVTTQAREHLHRWGHTDRFCQVSRVSNGRAWFLLWFPIGGASTSGAAHGSSDWRALSVVTG